MAHVEELRRRQAEELMFLLKKETQREESRLKAMKAEASVARRRMLEGKFEFERRKAQERMQAVKMDHEMAIVKHMTRLGLLR